VGGGAWGGGVGGWGRGAAGGGGGGGGGGGEHAVRRGAKEDALLFIFFPCPAPPATRRRVGGVALWVGAPRRAHRGLPGPLLDGPDPVGSAEGEVPRGPPSPAGRPSAARSSWRRPRPTGRPRALAVPLAVAPSVCGRWRGWIDVGPAGDPPYLCWAPLSVGDAAGHPHGGAPPRRRSDGQSSCPLRLTADPGRPPPAGVPSLAPVDLSAWRPPPTAVGTCPARRAVAEGVAPFMRRASSAPYPPDTSWATARRLPLLHRARHAPTAGRLSRQEGETRSRPSRGALAGSHRGGDRPVQR